MYSYRSFSIIQQLSLFFITLKDQPRTQSIFKCKRTLTVTDGAGKWKIQWQTTKLKLQKETKNNSKQSILQNYKKIAVDIFFFMQQSFPRLQRSHKQYFQNYHSKKSKTTHYTTFEGKCRHVGPWLVCELAAPF